MDWRDWELFCEVVQHGGFSAAARVLGHPKSSLSAAVQRLDPAIDGVAGIGQAQMPGRSLDQPQPELTFEPLHGSTEAGFGVPKHACGSAKAAVLDNLAK